jgi:hypothetical protein
MSDTITKAVREPNTIFVLLTLKATKDQRGIDNVCILSGPTADAWCLMLTGAVNAALNDAGVLSPREAERMKWAHLVINPANCFAVHNVNETLFFASVTNWRTGLAIVRDKLDYLGLLPFAQISYFDCREGVIASFYPPGSPPHDVEAILAKWQRPKPPTP